MTCKYVIYKIQSKIKPERIYIGSATIVERRWKLHLFQLRKGIHHSRKLQNHYNKYGESDLQFSILLGCEKEELIDKEQFFIDSLNPYFNICQLVGSTRGIKLSEDTRKKMSISRQKEKNPFFGKHHSEETKAKFRGPFSEERLKNISIAQKKRFESKEEKERVSRQFKGNIPWNKGKKGLTISWNKGLKMKPRTEEYRNKIRNIILKIKPWEKRVYKTASIETRKKQSESGIMAWELRHLNKEKIAS
jgi:group I intron endonuclease